MTYFFQYQTTQKNGSKFGSEHHLHHRPNRRLRNDTNSNFITNDLIKHSKFSNTCRSPAKFRRDRTRGSGHEREHEFSQKRKTFGSFESNGVSGSVGLYEFCCVGFDDLEISLCDCRVARLCVGSRKIDIDVQVSIISHDPEKFRRFLRWFITAKFFGDFRGGL